MKHPAALASTTQQLPPADKETTDWRCRGFQQSARDLLGLHI
jgi:hypothetical protein